MKNTHRIFHCPHVTVMSREHSGNEREMICPGFPNNIMIQIAHSTLMNGRPPSIGITTCLRCSENLRSNMPLKGLPPVTGKLLSLRLHPTPPLPSCRETPNQAHCRTKAEHVKPPLRPRFVSSPLGTWPSFHPCVLLNVAEPPGASS